MRSGDGNCGADIDILALYRAFKEPWSEMAKGIHRHDLLLVSPLGERTNIGSGFGVREVRAENVSFYIGRGFASTIDHESRGSRSHTLES